MYSHAIMTAHTPDNSFPDPQIQNYSMPGVERYGIRPFGQTLGHAGLSLVQRGLVELRDFPVRAGGALLGAILGDEFGDTCGDAGLLYEMDTDDLQAE